MVHQRIIVISPFEKMNGARIIYSPDKTYFLALLSFKGQVLKDEQ